MTDDILLRYDFYFENTVSGLTLHIFFFTQRSWVRLRTSFCSPWKAVKMKVGLKFSEQWPLLDKSDKQHISRTEAFSQSSTSQLL